MRTGISIALTTSQRRRLKGLLGGYRALDCSHDGGEFHEHAIVSRLDDAAAVAGHNRIDGGPVLAKGLGRAGLVNAHQPAVSGYIGGQDGGKLAWRVHAPSRSD